MQIDYYKSIQNFDHRLEMHTVYISISNTNWCTQRVQFRSEKFNAKSLPVQIRGGGAAALFCRAVGRSKKSGGRVVIQGTLNENVLL